MPEEDGKEIGEIDRYRQHGGFVCPYAKQKPHYDTLNVFSGADLDKAIYDILSTFIKSQERVLILFLDTTLTTHEQGNQQAQSIYQALVKAGSFIDKVEPREPGQCTFECNGERLMAFAMNPLYHESHPRYSPHPIMVLNYYGDINKSSMDIALAIRTKALERIAHAKSPDIPLEALAGKIRIILDDVTRRVSYIDVADDIATPQVVGAVQGYSMKTPLYILE